MYWYYGFDWTYFVLVLPTLLFALWAQAHVNSTFKKYSRVRNMRGMTGAQAAQAVLSANGVYGVRIERISGNLTALTGDALVFRKSLRLVGLGKLGRSGLSKHIEYQFQRGHVVPQIFFLQSFEVLILPCGHARPRFGDLIRQDSVFHAFLNATVLTFVGQFLAHLNSL